MQTWGCRYHRISALGRGRDQSLLSPLRDDKKRQPSTHQDKGPHKTLNLPELWFFDIPASRTVINKCSLFKLPCVWNFVIAPQLTKTVLYHMHIPEFANKVHVISRTRKVWDFTLLISKWVSLLLFHKCWQKTQDS